MGERGRRHHSCRPALLSLNSSSPLLLLGLEDSPAQLVASHCCSSDSVCYLFEAFYIRWCMRPRGLLRFRFLTGSQMQSLAWLARLWWQIGCEVQGTSTSRRVHLPPALVLERLSAPPMAAC